MEIGWEDLLQKELMTQADLRFYGINDLDSLQKFLKKKELQDCDDLSPEDMLLDNKLGQPDL